MTFSRSFVLACSPILALGSACSTVEIVDDGAPPAAPGEPDNPSEPACVIDPADRILLRSPTSATLIGRRLHIEAELGGAPVYAVLEPASSELATLEGVHPELEGGASWTPQAEGYWARVRGTQLDVMAMFEQGGSLVGTVDLPSAQVAGSDAIAFDGASLHLCLEEPDGAPALLHRFDVTTTPALPIHDGAGEPCDVYPGRGLAEGDLWVDTGEMDVHFLGLASGVANGHGWNPDGVHSYGLMTGVETDGHVIAVTLENQAYTFLYYTAESEQYVVYSSFGGGEKKLLDVVDGRAIMAVPKDGGVEIEAFELVPAPAWGVTAPRGDLAITLSSVAGDASGLRMLTHDTERAVLTDGTSAFLVPLHGTGTVAPLYVAEPGAGVVCD